MKLDKINFIAPLGKSDIQGYHITSRLIIKLMDEMGVDLRVVNLDKEIIPEFEHLQKKENGDRFNLLREIPTVDPYVDGYYTVTEFDQPTWGSIPLIMKSKFLITESFFCKSIYEKYAKCPVKIIQTPLTDEFKPDGPKAVFNSEIDDFGFKFLSVFEWVMRKDPYTLIKAFCDEFDKDEDVCLILRTYSPKENIKLWLGKLAKDHNVFWIKEKVKDVSALYRACDCHVSSTLGEGFGRTFVESMACGTLNIIPESTALTEYANRSNALIVPTVEQFVGNRINEFPHLIGHWFKCWPVDYPHLRAAMRVAVESDCEVFKKNATKVKDLFSEENTKQQISEVFKIEKD